MGKVMIDMMVEFGGDCHRLLIIHCICIMGKLMRDMMVEFGAGHHILLIHPGIQDIKKAMRATKEEV
eukprot:1646795-Ditylum_brightwellii.AAC.1